VQRKRLVVYPPFECVQTKHRTHKPIHLTWQYIDYLKIMGLQNEAVCPLCQDEEETSIHFTVQCSATMLLRRSILGDYTLSLDTLNSIHWTVLLRFAKASRRFFDHGVCWGCALSPNLGLSAGVSCAPTPKVR